MRSLCTTLAVLCAACGGSSADPDALDAATERWTWSFVDASGNVVGCPPGVTTIELTTWNRVMGPGDGCTNTPNPSRSQQERFPCEPGEAFFDAAGTPRLDVLLEDDRVYARVDAEDLLDHHVDIVTPRGFVALAWSMYNPTTMLERWCSDFQMIDTTWLGPYETIYCRMDAPAKRVVLPGQPVGDQTWKAWLTHPISACGGMDQLQTFTTTLVADQTTEVNVQFTTTQ